MPGGSAGRSQRRAGPGISPPREDQSVTAEPSHAQCDPAAVVLGYVRARQEELDGLRVDFPAYRIWCEVVGTRVRLVAVSELLGVSPHTVVTGDPAELREALAGSAPGIRHP